MQLNINLCLLVASGTLMHCSSHNSTLPVIHTIHSSWKVGITSSLDCSSSATYGFLLMVIWLSHVEPSTTRELPEDYVERVKSVHESGGYGSRGYVIFSNLFIPTLRFAFWCDLILFLKDMDMTGKERKQTKISWELTQLLSPPECLRH